LYISPTKKQFKSHNLDVELRLAGAGSNMGKGNGGNKGLWEITLLVEEPVPK